MRVRWLRSALRDLESQIDFIAAENPNAAERVSGRLYNALNRLAEFPEMGRVGRVSGTRELVVSGTPWIAVYRVGQAVEIVRLIHMAQRWPPRPRS